jgi:hypothetical protein
MNCPRQYCDFLALRTSGPAAKGPGQKLNYSFSATVAFLPK